VQSLFITATGTNIGKTHTTLRLIEILAAQGLSVGVFKPIETGVVDRAPDALKLLTACQKVNPRFASFSPDDITAYTFPLPAAPFCADREETIRIDVILAQYQALSKACDILLVEGAGGLMVPITKEFFMIDLADLLNIPILLVTPSRLGSINDTLLSIEALKARKLSFEWCVNLYEDTTDFATVTQPFYDACFPDWWQCDTGLEAFAKRVCQ